MLDKNKPYGTIFGTPKDNARFVQNGNRYLNNGEPAKVAAKKAAKKTVKPVSETEESTSVNE